MGGTIRKNQEKRGYFSGMSPQIFKKGEILHVLMSICLSRMFELLHINVLEL